MIVFLPIIVIGILAGLHFHLRSLYRTQFENQFPRLRDCAIKARQVKEDGIKLANTLKFDRAVAELGSARDFYQYCEVFFPTGLSAFYNSGRDLDGARKAFYMDFSDLFFQFALIQQAEENQKPDLDLALGAISMAIETIDKACEAVGDDYCVSRKQSYFTILGDMYRVKKDFKRAVNMFKQADTLKPDDPANLSFWGLSLFESGDHKGAQKKWERAVAKDPNAPAKEMIRQYAVSSNAPRPPLKVRGGEGEL
ncbi:MAG: hypothetical protein HY541_06820 [Deltaproteobacteria bacterium]|nr:hypothetical protein [Deltaproteobacteria bacterium]